jgi:hypothetical protein
MIQCMPPSQRKFHSAFLILAGGLFVHQLLPAKTRHIPGAGNAVPLELTVHIYSLSEVSTWTLTAAETEAARMLRQVHLNLKWVNCRPPMPAGPCFSPESATDLVVRIVPKAWPRANSRMVGMASSSGNPAVFLFYDRIVSLRTYTNALPDILGRVLAHELVHLLLPAESHANTGLMSAHWSYSYLERRNARGLELSERLVEEVQANVRQRMAAVKQQNAGDRTMALITKHRR